MRGILILIISVALVSACASGRDRGGASPDLPPIERLANTGTFVVNISAATGLQGEFSIPLLEGLHPAVVFANDGSSAADQVKAEARLLARHGFAVLAVSLTEEDTLRQIAQAGAAVINQPGVFTTQAVLVSFTRDPATVLEAHRRLVGYRTLVLVDPPAPPPLEEFVDVSAPVFVFFQADASEELVTAWSDALALVSSVSAVLVDSSSSRRTSNGVLSIEQRDTLIDILREEV